MYSVIIKLAALIVVALSLPLWLEILSYGLNSSQSTAPVALVLGASVTTRQTPSAVLQQRLDTAVKLYNDNIVKTILVSGDNRTDTYNEPLVMKEYLESQGVPESNILMDFAGNRTIDSCWRAKYVFGATSVYLVTQGFHMPRAHYVCNRVGLNNTPAVADDSSIEVSGSGIIREIPAAWLAIFETTTNYTPPIKADGNEQKITP